MRAACFFGLLVLGTAGAAMAAGQADEASIRSLQQQQAVAWNDHEIASYAALFTADADVINVLGWQWHSRAELQQKLGAGFKSVFAKSRMSIGEVTVEFVKPDVAVAHVRWTMTGALSPTGSGNDAPEQGIQTQVLVKQGGSWKIKDFQNTNSVPETAFPQAR
ncbi:MAG: SgcJ/EcaC family oxidoreductase [Croceibacterium sp.]